MLSTIRTATPEDVLALAELKLCTFRETFLDGFGIPYPPADLRAFEAEAYAAERIAAELRDDSHRTWVIDGPAGQLAAYAHVGPCKLPHREVMQGDPEIYQLYLRKTAQGAGLGKRLLDTALTFIGDSRPVWLGVWSGNVRAQHIYTGRGFQPVGQYQFAVGEWRDDEVIMRRPARL